MPISFHRLPFWRGHAVLAKFFLRSNLVEGEFTRLYIFTGVRDAAVLENFLHLAVFAERSMQGDECKIDIVRQLKILVAHIHIGDFYA